MAIDERRTKAIADNYRLLRQQHPAWRLLASRRAPLVIGCLQTLFEQNTDRVRVEDAIETLTAMLADYANDPDYEITTANYSRLARRELRTHIKARLLVERYGELTPTDALLQVFRFLKRIENRIMSSTASRLATVQHQIAEVAVGLNPDPEARAARIRDQIAELEDELERVGRGDVDVLDGDDAVEAIREVYSLATSLHDDFGRVEDSYRRADQNLRVSIIRDHQHRGTVVDKLLDSHAQLVETAEGRVFATFYTQLNETDDLERMSRNLSQLLDTLSASTALSRHQKGELRRLRSRLVSDAGNVVRARARSESDVRNYLRTGMGLEHQRVGQLVEQILDAALDVDWSKQDTRRSASSLRPLGAAVTVTPVGRLRIKDINIDEGTNLDFRSQAVDLDEVDDEIWRALAGLDRQALARETVETVATYGGPMTMAQLATELPPTHDLETISVWVEMACQAGVDTDNSRTESIDVTTDEGVKVQFRAPLILFDPAAIADQTWEL